MFAKTNYRRVLVDRSYHQFSYSLTENARITRVPEQQYRSLEQEPYEYSTEPRADEAEWDQLVKFGLRKVEK